MKASEEMEGKLLESSTRIGYVLVRWVVAANGHGWLSWCSSGDPIKTIEEAREKCVVWNQDYSLPDSSINGNPFRVARIRIQTDVVLAEDE